MITREILEDILDMTVKAGRTALGYFNKATLKTAIKADRSLLSEADTATEELIIRHLSGLFPGDTFIGEESISGVDLTPARAMEESHVWVIDPIDGTSNFIAGLPLWCIAIARLERGIPTLGIIHLPAIGGELYYNEGASLFFCEHADFRSPRPMSRPGTTDGNNKLFMAHDSFYERFRLDYPHIPRISGSAVLNALYVMLGKSIGAITSAHLWDFAAPMAYASGCGVQMLEVFSGRVVEKFTADDFYFGEDPHQAWRIRYECLIAHASIADEMRRRIRRLKDR